MNNWPMLLRHLWDNFHFKFSWCMTVSVKAERDEYGFMESQRSAGPTSTHLTETVQVFFSILLIFFTTHLLLLLTLLSPWVKGSVSQ